MDTELQYLARVVSSLILFSKSQSSIPASPILMLHQKSSVICFSIPRSFNSSFLVTVVHVSFNNKGSGCGRAMVLEMVAVERWCWRWLRSGDGAGGGCGRAMVLEVVAVGRWYWRWLRSGDGTGGGCGRAMVLEVVAVGRWC